MDDGETFFNDLNRKQNDALNDVNEALAGISYEEQSLNLDSVNFGQSFDISQPLPVPLPEPISSESFKSLSFNGSLSRSVEQPAETVQKVEHSAVSYAQVEASRQVEVSNISQPAQSQVNFEPDSTINMEKYLQKVNDELQQELDQANVHMRDVSTVRSNILVKDSIDEEFDKLLSRPVLLPEVSIDTSIEIPRKKSVRKTIPLPDVTEDITHLFQKVSPPKRTSSQLSSPHPLGPYVDVELENSLFGHQKLPEVEECDFDKSHGAIKLPADDHIDEFKVLQDRVQHLEQDKSQLRQKVEQLSSRKQSPVQDRKQSPNVRKQPPKQVIVEPETSFEQENSFDMDKINKQNDVVTLKSKISLLERRLEHSEFTSKKYQDERDLALHDAELLKREVQRLQLQVTELRRQLSSAPDTKEKLKQDVKQKLMSRSVGVAAYAPKKVTSPLRSTIQVTRKKQVLPTSNQRTWNQLKAHDLNTCELCKSGSQFRHYDHALDVTREDIDGLIQMLEKERYVLDQKYEAVLDQYKNKKYQNEDSIITEMNSLLETMTSKAEELQQLKKTQQAHGLQVPKGSQSHAKEHQRLSKLKHVCQGNCD